MFAPLEVCRPGGKIEGDPQNTFAVEKYLQFFSCQFFVKWIFSFFLPSFLSFSTPLYSLIYLCIYLSRKNAPMRSTRPTRNFELKTCNVMLSLYYWLQSLRHGDSVACRQVIHAKQSSSQFWVVSKKGTNWYHLRCKISSHNLFFYKRVATLVFLQLWENLLGTL